MTVKEFVEKYNTFNNEESKMKVVDDIMNNHYVPYEEKEVLCKNIVKASHYKTVKNTDGTEYKKLHFDGVTDYMLYCLTLVKTYTKIELNLSDTLNEFNLLNEYINEEYGLIDLIMSKINKRELTEFGMILDLVKTDVVKNEYETHAYISSQVERFGELTGIAIIPMIDKLIDAINNVDDKTIDKAANMFSKISGTKIFK